MKIRVKVHSDDNNFFRHLDLKIDDEEMLLQKLPDVQEFLQNELYEIEDTDGYRK